MRVILKPMGIVAVFVLLAAVFAAGFAIHHATSSPPPGSIVRMDATGSDADTGASKVVAPVNLDPRSPVKNASFEQKVGAKTPADWNIDMAGGNAVSCSYVEGKGDAHSGALHCTHYGGDNYNVRTTQTLTGLKDGLYTLRAWTEKNPGKENESYLVAKDFAPGHPKKMTFIPDGETKWQQITVRDIAVKGGQCTIGIFTQAKGGQWTKFDDVEFIPQN